MQNRKWAGRLALALVAVGLAVSLYLYVRGNKLASVENIAGAAGSDVCSAVFQTSCDGTLQSAYSHILGLSVAGWGVVYFAAIGALLVAGSMLRTSFLSAALAVALGINLIGL